MLPPDYLERVYAGVLGKIIGVYIGRPFEGWLNERIERELGEIRYYVHERLGSPLVVTDDDISGTFAFLRALPENGFPASLTPAQVGETWMNALIEMETILWWGGMGTSTEHTAYLRMKHGHLPPASGSIALNGKIVAEQIGAQIFIDGWGMVCPNDPERAVAYAKAAAQVSHDGEAVNGAVVIAAMVSMAFDGRSVDALIDGALGFIDSNSIIAKMIGDVRNWHAQGLDWRAGFRKLDEQYGYAKYGGGCHMVPNHGLIIHALLHGGGNFSESQMIVNTCGWDTDCNAANVGSILGVRGGTAQFEYGPDWRGPVADRMFLPTADGRYGITDAATEAVRIANYGRILAGLSPDLPKGGAKFHFALSGSVQGFTVSNALPSRGVCEIRNVGDALQIDYRQLSKGRVGRTTTATFLNEEAISMPGYGVLASPTLHPGQTIRAKVRSTKGEAPVNASLVLAYFGSDDKVYYRNSEGIHLLPGAMAELEWVVPDLGGFPICEVGIDLTSDFRIDGQIELESLTWSGPVTVDLQPTAGGKRWINAFIKGVNHFFTWGSGIEVVQDEGTGILSQGGPDWADLSVESEIVTSLLARAGVAVRVQGMRRWVALLLYPDGTVRLVESAGNERELGSAPLTWSYGDTVRLKLEARGDSFLGYANGELVIEAQSNRLKDGAVALVVTEGRIKTERIAVRPV